MKLRSGGLSANIHAGSLCAILALWMIAPAPARAGCDAHYITSLLQRSSGSSPLDLFDFGGNGAGDSSDHREESLQGKPAGCTGALCSGNPGTVPSTIPTALIVVAGECALFAGPLPLYGPDSFSGLPEDTNLRPINSPFLIFHPPRPSLRVPSYPRAV